MFFNGDPSHPFNRQPFTANYPQPFPASDFQKGLTGLFGREAQTQRPWLRVIWAGSEDRDEWGPIPCDWSDYGAGGRGEWRRRYLYSSSVSYGEAYDEARSLYISREVWTDVSPPRFVIERLIPAAVACMGWNNHATILLHSPGFAEGRDSDGDAFTARKPIGGLYVPLEVDDRKTIRGGVIGDHNGTCCRNAEQSDRICYGTFAAPGEGHLELLRDLTRQIKAKPERRPGLITPDELAGIRKRTYAAYSDYWQGVEDRMTERIREALKTHAGMLSDDPTVNRNGIYHFVGANAGHSKSGATKEQIEQWQRNKAG